MLKVTDRPFVSVIVLNFNGVTFLKDCLSSLEHLNYPRDAYEVILVDNASSDQSVHYVRKQFPWVKIVQNSSNLGYAAGNNVGIRESKGDYIALLNNDTKVEPDWLMELVKICEQDPSVGACTSKILLFDDRLRIHLKTHSFKPSDYGNPLDARELGVLVEEAVVRGADGEQAVEFSEGFYEKEKLGEKICRWSMGEAVFTILVAPNERKLILQLTLSNPRPRGAALAPVLLYVGERQCAELTIETGSTVHEITLEQDLLQDARPLIQNAGSLILPDGSGRDRGAIVRNAQQHFEEDRGQYDRIEEVFAACGAGALYRRKMLEDVGLLDEYFFMYYEDTDLAWRARLKGWTIMYTPYAVMRHVHCGTSIEWSPSFVFHAYRNRLAMLMKNAPILLVVREWTHALVSWLLLGLRIVMGRALRGAESVHATSHFRLRASALRSLLLALPALYKKRQEIQRTGQVALREVTRWMQPPEQ